MKVSIITPTYNSSATIGDTLDSIYSQSYADIEHLIIDGGSKDDTLDIARSYARDNVVIISEPDKGIYDAMNKGVRNASGDIIAILNSDDYYASPEVVSGMVEFFMANNLEAAWGDIEYVGGKGPIKRYWKGGNYRPGKFRFGWVPPHPAFFCKKELFEKFGAFRLDMPVAADYELMLRFIEVNRAKCGYNPILVTRMRVGGNSGNFRNIVKGNFSDIVNSYQINGLDQPWQLFICKPFMKLSQLRL